MSKLNYNVVLLSDYGGFGTIPYAINVNGYVVGESDTANSEVAVLWSPTGRATWLVSRESTALAINKNGQTIGNAYTAQGENAYFFTSRGRAFQLQDVGGYGSSTVRGLNDKGQSVGISPFATSTRYGQYAVLWSASGAGTILQDVGGAGESGANAINDRGQIAGYSQYARDPSLGGDNTEAVVWSAANGVTVLEDVGGAQSSAAWGINGFGYTFGQSATARGVDSVLWSPTGAGTILADPGGRANTDVLALNNREQSVGWSDAWGGLRDAVLWSADGSATVLFDAGKHGYSEAVAINSAGESVGYSEIAGRQTTAVLWNAKGNAYDLGSQLGAGWTSSYATGVNDAGQVTGWGVDNGVSQGFILTPNVS